MANSKEQRAKSKWQMANGKWQMANGKEQRANRKGQMAKSMNRTHSHFAKIVFVGLLALGYLLFAAPAALAASNIDATYRWAWNDVIGWIDFQFGANPNVEVRDDRLLGYASSSVGYISLECATGPPGSDCSVSYGVSNTNGTLSGWAWNDAIGWISFNCANTATCGAANYAVRVSGGEFSGWAWNDAIGWISFNCANTVTCGEVDYKVRTDWSPPVATGILESAIFDSGVKGGPLWHTILWQGALNGGEVKFLIASSESSSGPWQFIGPDGTSATYYGGGLTGPDTPIALTFTDHNNKRYIRYRMYLTSSADGQSPRVDDVTLGYSP